MRIFNFWYVPPNDGYRRGNLFVNAVQQLWDCRGTLKDPTYTKIYVAFLAMTSADVAMTECDGTITSHLPFSNILVKIPPVSIKAIDQVYLLLAASAFNLFLSTNCFFY